MKLLRSWLVVIGVFGRYWLYKLKLADPPTGEGKFDEFLQVVGPFVGWNRYIRVENADLCAKDHPAIFFGNHLKLDDPLYLFKAVYTASGGGVTLRAMLRDDFFKGTILKSRFLDLDELLHFMGAYGISRGNVTLGQIKTFVDVLQRGESFMLYPGRSRSCSGMLIDYRDNIQTPGGISFFLHALQNRDPDLKASAIPAARNYNLVTRHTSVIFGPEQILKRGASREEQRAFDSRLIEVLGHLIEINVTQILAALLYMRCLHGMKAPIAVDDLSEMVQGLIDETRHPYIDPEDAEDIPAAVDRTLRFFRKCGMLERNGAKVIPNVEKILSVPELTTKYRKENPVKYLTNQILHLGDVTALIEAKVLGLPVASHTTSLPDTRAL